LKQPWTGQRTLFSEPHEDALANQLTGSVALDDALSLTNVKPGEAVGGDIGKEFQRFRPLDNKVRD